MKTNRKGMTLIEVLITIAIMSIVVMMAYSFLTYGMTIFDKSGDMADDQSMVRLAANVITEQMRTALDIEIDDLDPDNPVVQSGKNGIYLEDTVLTIELNEEGRLVTVPGIASVHFTLNEDANSNLNLYFTLTGIHGFALDSTVYLNNYNIVNTSTGLGDFTDFDGVNLTFRKP